jgi:hypothetical protein
MLFGQLSVKLPFMTRLLKKWGITQDGEDKSLILRWIFNLYTHVLSLKRMMNAIGVALSA